MTVRTLLASTAAMMLLCSGCRKGTVETYRIPKETDPEMPPALASTAPASAPAGPGSQAGAMADTPVATTQGNALVWTAPERWQAKTGSSMRKGSYAVPGDAGQSADLAITAFPGDVGGELANVNRWRGQLQLPPISAAELAGAVERFESSGLKFGVVEFVATGDAPQRMLGAFVPHGGSTWFFKLVGPDALVARTKPEFLAFLRTVKPTANP